MNITEYLTRLHKESESILTNSLESRDELGKSHHFAACIYEFSETLVDQAEKDILRTVSSQMESATLCASIGMYRQAFTSLRLAFEMGLGSAYFSVHKLELQEWVTGKGDIKWSSLVDENTGVISKRFANAFFSEFSEDVTTYRNKAIDIYRELSEFVHGNKETWTNSKIELAFDNQRLSYYFECIGRVYEVLLFVLSCRYLKSLPATTIESLEFIQDELNHLHYVREYFGGQVDG
jgi:hypothetical protein